MIATQHSTDTAQSSATGSGAVRRARQCGFTTVELMIAVAIVAVLTAIALPSYAKYRDRIRNFNAAEDIASLQPLITQYALDNRNAYPASLADIGRGGLKDPWGNAYQYVSHDDPTGRGAWRKDHNIVPINSDYDLWSNGKDGQTAPPLTAGSSRDDILRANNGRFVGLASDFDP
jgi:general secretion pathway protein G